MQYFANSIPYDLSQNRRYIPAVHISVLFHTPFSGHMLNRELKNRRLRYYTLVKGEIPAAVMLHQAGQRVELLLFRHKFNPAYAHYALVFHGAVTVLLVSNESVGAVHFKRGGFIAFCQIELLAL